MAYQDEKDPDDVELWCHLHVAESKERYTNNLARVCMSIQQPY